ncbi:MAG: type II toxin-antitoxin system prevent-host-death family antitoxin [Rhodoferax sp.]|nr:type II toxin-antitoxin system prevent-host-death family antitoxin [Rhodoferax sp.]
MSAVWQVQEAKNRFSEMIEQALSLGPQVITRHGRPVVRVVAANAAADPSIAPAQSAIQADGFTQYLLGMPRADDFQLPVRRSRKHPIALGS